MEFHEKLQELRKRRGLTQEELAGLLFVSRTAVSKWESGRGYPNLDSLQAIAKLYSVTIDQLLSGDEALTIAEETHRQREARLRDLVFGLLDCSSILLLILPLFGQRTTEGVLSVPLLALTAAPLYLRLAYGALTVGLILWGILTLALQDCQHPGWLRWKTRVSLLLHAVGGVILTVSRQAYAAAFLLVLLLVKSLTAVKWS